MLKQKIYLSLVLVTLPQNLFIPFFTSFLFLKISSFSFSISLKALFFLFIYSWFPSSLVFILKVIFLLLIRSWIPPLILGISDFIMVSCHVLYHILFYLVITFPFLTFTIKHFFFNNIWEQVFSHFLPSRHFSSLLPLYYTSINETFRIFSLLYPSLLVETFRTYSIYFCPFYLHLIPRFRWEKLVLSFHFTKFFVFLCSMSFLF